MSTLGIEQVLEGQRIIPVLAFNSVEDALVTCGLLVEEGITALEITLRTPAALDCIRAVAEAYPQAHAGVGTILTAAQLERAREAGAVFGVSPGLTPGLASAITAAGMPFLPGVATISEAMTASDYGFSHLKLFPAEQSGGVGFLRAAGSVLPNIKFCPTGGLNPDNAAGYLALENTAAIGGSWMIKRTANGETDLEATREAVRASMKL